ncbi:MAG: excisionase family DNA-binding protein [Bacteroidales bacterium]|nr:excisionase family DNA-binding protein [Bacteroidales bacterium]
MEFSKTDILRLIERASAIPELLSRRDEIENLVERFKEVEDYLERFQSLEELITHLKWLEDQLYICKTYMSTEDASKYLSLSVYTMREIIKRREIPYYTPPGKGYCLLKDDLDAWMETFRVEKPSDVDQAEERDRRADETAHSKGWKNEKQG